MISGNTAGNTKVICKTHKHTHTHHSRVGDFVNRYHSSVLVEQHWTHKHTHTHTNTRTQTHTHTSHFHRAVMQHTTTTVGKTVIKISGQFWCCHVPSTSLPVLHMLCIFSSSACPLSPPLRHPPLPSFSFLQIPLCSAPAAGHFLSLLFPPRSSLAHCALYGQVGYFPLWIEQHLKQLHVGHMNTHTCVSETFFLFDLLKHS